LTKHFKPLQGYAIMEPFNIKVGFGENEVTLTILPTENFYKVVYYGGILGAIKYENDTDGWELMSREEYTAGDLPFYTQELNSDRLEFVLDDNMVDHIGEEIENKLYDPEAE